MLTVCFYSFSKPNYDEQLTHSLPQDTILKELLSTYPKTIYKYHEHDSLLENKVEEELTEEEKQEAWVEFRKEQAKLTTKENKTNENGEAPLSPSNFVEGENALGALGSSLSEPLDLSPFASFVAPEPVSSPQEASTLINFLKRGYTTDIFESTSSAKKPNE